MTFSAVAILFPGQGSQSKGMLTALAATEPLVLSTFAEGSVALGYDLWKLVSDGPEDQLNTTEFTQPAMLAAGIAIWRVWCERGGVRPDVLSGHSLGEFTALVAAQALDFGAALDLVRHRGQLMQTAVPQGEGAMAAVLGMDDEALEQVCREAAQGEVVEAVNFNAPGQVVIAGQSTAVTRAIELAKSRGAKRAVLLPVSVPSHSSLMNDAAQQLGERLKSMNFSKPVIPYWSAVDCVAHSDPDDIRQTLVQQLASPVRWSKLIKALTATGIRSFVECGPGKVLTGVNKRIEKNPDLQYFAVDDPTNIAAAIAATVNTNV
ncbi:MAG: ACP S-malonyltransferase [Steroidobacteraceae bacterium]